ncbi:hypothetical protein BDZ97DRAFT_1653444 [Flammula alnicola]|nr:hypothetical protein BDZ97DRAFT_1653444 [Flammula alnicola]
MAEAPSVLNIHTPTSSFAIVHSLTQETLLDLYNKLSRKANTDYYGERVGPGWLKYEYNEAIWNLDDDSDYTIFVWRRQQQQQQDDPAPSINLAPTTMSATPTLHLRNPQKPLPTPPAYLNPSFYMFQPSCAYTPTPRRSPTPSHASTSRRSKKGKNGLDDVSENDSVPKFKREFERFHSENGVRTVMGQIGPVHNVRMLLKSGYRHVYISRKFAIKHGFIPPDAAPGNYGYGGLVNIGSWPITLTPSSTQPNLPAAGNVNKKHQHQNEVQSDRHTNANFGPKPVTVEVYLSEEPHFDVVLGRSFIEKRQVKTNSIDPTDVVCLDTGEKIECELVILKDGRGEIVTVT